LCVDRDGRIAVRLVAASPVEATAGFHRSGSVAGGRLAPTVAGHRRGVGQAVAPCQ
jgi:hypothetical protein